jgi:transcriptional regulator with XRE-family HTH domain
MKIRLRADVLRETAAKRNQNLSDVAAEAGTDLRYLMRLMRGKHEPTARTRRRLCEALGLKFGRLFRIERDAQN